MNTSPTGSASNDANLPDVAKKGIVRNPRGNPETLKQGNSKPGIGIPGNFRVRMQDQELADEFVALMDAAPWGHGPDVLGKLISEALTARKQPATYADRANTALAAMREPDHETTPVIQRRELGGFAFRGQQGGKVRQIVTRTAAGFHVHRLTFDAAGQLTRVRALGTPDSLAEALRQAGEYQGQTPET